FIANNPKIKPIDFKFQGNVSGYADGGINGSDYYEAILMIYEESVNELTNKTTNYTNSQL
ncbi:hypothetical protein ACFKJK_01435, partial [Streptococcus agalactiae]